jgi:hypothetical protein
MAWTDKAIDGTANGFGSITMDAYTDGSEPIYHLKDLNDGGNQGKNVAQIQFELIDPDSEVSDTSKVILVRHDDFDGDFISEGFFYGHKDIVIIHGSHNIKRTSFTPLLEGLTNAKVKVLVQYYEDNN